MDLSPSSQEDWETLMELEEALAGWLIQGSDWNQDWLWGSRTNPYQDEEIPAVSQESCEIPIVRDLFSHSLTAFSNNRF